MKKYIILLACVLMSFPISCDGQNASYVVDETPNLVKLRAMSSFCLEFKRKTGGYPISLVDLKMFFSSLIDSEVIYECSFYINPHNKMMENWKFGERDVNGLKSVLSSDVFQYVDKKVMYCMLESGEVRRLLIEK